MMSTHTAALEAFPFAQADTPMIQTAKAKLKGFLADEGERLVSRPGVFSFPCF
jgi:hypothetical protein